ncbi:MAG TPA: GTP-binding protein [Gemmatales bacterium]|nr:GTP-binding protein [Gemmatales bacterium]HMP61259.1 GTP-binding protein [Gemmatales bacterium]
MTLSAWWGRFQNHDRLALARLITWAAQGQQVAELWQRLKERPDSGPPARVIAFTGSGGVGKSTLVGRMLESFRAKGRRVAILACDPESPLTGGALLGDRLRMPAAADDEVYIRSLATPGGHEAVPEHLDLIVALVAAFGFEIILLETVGAGQGDTAARHLVDLLVLLVQPETGDDIQWEKAGLLEVADVVVVHKADMPGADRTLAQVQSLLHLPGCRDVPVMRVSSQTREGIDALRDLLETSPTQRHPSRWTSATLLRLAQERLADDWRSRPEALAALVARVQAGALAPAAAADLLRQPAP